MNAGHIGLTASQQQDECTGPTDWSLSVWSCRVITAGSGEEIKPSIHNEQSQSESSNVVHFKYYISKCQQQKNPTVNITLHQP